MHLEYMTTLLNRAENLHDTDGVCCFLLLFGVYIFFIFLCFFAAAASLLLKFLKATNLRYWLRWGGNNLIYVRLFKKNSLVSATAAAPAPTITAPVAVIRFFYRVKKTHLWKVSFFFLSPFFFCWLVCCYGRCLHTFFHRLFCSEFCLRSCIRFSLSSYLTLSLWYLRALFFVSFVSISVSVFVSFGFFLLLYLLSGNTFSTLNNMVFHKIS